MLLTLALSLLSGQVIYEWIDAQGDSHFTDDVSTIPAKAKRRITSGVEPVLSTTRPDGGADAGASAQRPRPQPVTPAGPGQCELAKRRLEELEQQVEREKSALAEAQAREDSRCQEVLNLHGQTAFARCMAGRAERAQPHASTSASRIEEAREALRRAQVGGCR